jgi:hypothetical protein
VQNSGASQLVYCMGNYIHDSTTGYTFNSVGGGTCIGNIIEACTTSIAATSTAPNLTIMNNTLYGTEAKTGTGINLSGANSSGNKVMNNIIYGFTTGISVGTGPAPANLSLNNDFYNNTTDVSNWVKDPSDLAINPQFAGTSQYTGTTATSSGSVLTDSSASFAAVAGADYLHVVSGTGVTVGIYQITSSTSTTLTVNNALGTGSGITYFVTHGHNFAVTNSGLKGAGFPSFSNDSLTTGYPTPGAVVPSPSGPAATVACVFGG